MLLAASGFGFYSMAGSFLLLLLFCLTSIYATDRCEKSTIESFGFNYVIFKGKPINVTSRRVWADGNDFQLDTKAVQHNPIALESPIVKENVLVPLLEEQGMRLNSWYAICGLREINEGRLCEDCVVVRFCKCDCAKDKGYEIKLNVSWVKERDQVEVEASLEVPQGFYCPLQRRMVLTYTTGCSKHRGVHFQGEGQEQNGSSIVTTYPASGGNYVSSASFEPMTLSANPCFLKQELFLVAGKVPSENWVPSWSYSQMITVQKVLLNPMEMQGNLRMRKEAIVRALVPFEDVKESEILCREIESLRKEKKISLRKEKEMEKSGVKGSFDFFWFTLVIWMCLEMFIIFL